MFRTLLLGGSFVMSGLHAAPIALHPDNPHYFLYHNKPTVLITSAEHYGALINLDFDYVKYLDTLADDGLNLTRVFSGTYLEPEGAFNITLNTLAPKPGRYISPWARDKVSGKYDLTRWDHAYFLRLKDLVTQADKRGIIVEFTFFSPMYKEDQWKLSPMNAINNINGIGVVERNDILTLDKSGGLLTIQESLVRKIVSELHAAENVCYEICNEPYFGGVTMAWQHRIADIITETEKDYTHKHLITQNIANGAQKIKDPHPSVSVFNFHYANPPTAVELNYELNKVIGDNETGFKGTEEEHYRMEAWEFILAGGGLYNNLDYSFSVGHEDGTFKYPATQPGSGNPIFRKQMKSLKDFIDDLQFVRMKPSSDVIREMMPKDARAQLLAEHGRQYAAYLKGAPDHTFSLDLPAGIYQIKWLDVVTGRYETSKRLDHRGGPTDIHTPRDLNETAMKIVLQTK